MISQTEEHNKEVAKGNESFASRMRKIRQNYEESETTTDGRQGASSDEEHDKDCFTCFKHESGKTKDIAKTNPVVGKFSNPYATKSKGYQPKLKQEVKKPVKTAKK